MLIVMMIVKIILIMIVVILVIVVVGGSGHCILKFPKYQMSRKKRRTNDSISMHGNPVQTGYITLNLVVALFST